MGGGKSYFGAELILACLREGGVVMTNMPLRMDVIEAMGFTERVILLPPEITDWVSSEPGKLDPATGLTSRSTVTSRYIVGGAEGSENLVVVDEASMVLDVDEQQKNKVAHKPLYDLVRLCRHVGLDMFMLAQAHTHVAAKLRPMAESRVKCVNVEKLPFFGWLLRKIPWYGDFLRIHYQGQSQIPTGRSWHKFNATVASIYDTHGMRGGVAIKTSATRLKGTEFTKGKGKGKALMVLLLILGLAAFSFIRGKQAVTAIQKGREPITKENAAPVPSGGRQDAAVAPAVVESKPSGPAKKKRAWGPEWDEADELPYTSIVRTNGERLRVQVASGQFLHIGAFYDGERIRSVSSDCGWYYFQTEGGRWIVARPFNSAERRKLEDAAVAKRQEISQPKFLGAQ